MRQSVYAILSIVSIAVIGYGAATGMGFWGAVPLPRVIATGTYRSLGTTQFYDDHRDIRPSLAYDLEGLFGANREITGGSVEAGGNFSVIRGVPFGAQIRVLTGRYAGDKGYVKARELASGRAERIGELTQDTK